MNSDTLEGQWKQLKGHVRRQWGKLTDDDVDQVKGDAEVLAGKLQERYGRTREQAREEVRRFLERSQQVETRDDI